MKILLTGGSGFIGRNLCEQLVGRYQICAPASSELNLLDASAVREYLAREKFDAVVHTATTRSNRRMGAPADMLDRNCRMYFNLVRNRHLFGRMLHFGSGAEYGRPGMPPRVTEADFDQRVPVDPYGFSKYICTKHAETQSNIYVLKLFGVFGRYEAWDVRFISNACARAVKGLPIVIRQDVRFDYLYAPELARLLPWFLENEPRHKSYNVCLGRTFSLRELAEMVSACAQRRPEIIVRREELGEEYSGDNRRMMDELGGFAFRPMHDCVQELYDWYEQQADTIDVQQLKFDDSE